jgi:imidazolonepropionase-like amidohydrolase
MEKKIGQVAPGFFGDLVAVPGDPLVDVRVLESPRAVVKEGRLVFRSSGAEAGAR